MTQQNIVHWQILQTPACPLAFAWNSQGLLVTSFSKDPQMLKAYVAKHQLGIFDERASVDSSYERALERYFGGKLDALDKIKVAPVGTNFSMSVWTALQAIPCGETRTYGGLASSLERPGAARAVGMACNRNPIAIVIPCHRVVGSTGKLTGFAGGLKVKQWLLNHEGVETRAAQYELL